MAKVHIITKNGKEAVNEIMDLITKTELICVKIRELKSTLDYETDDAMLELRPLKRRKR